MGSASSAFAASLYEPCARPASRLFSPSVVPHGCHGMDVMVCSIRSVTRLGLVCEHPMGTSSLGFSSPQDRNPTHPMGRPGNVSGAHPVLPVQLSFCVRRVGHPMGST